MKRPPAVAGMFYPGDAIKLREAIEDCFVRSIGEVPKVNPQGERRIISVISPHAGYVYSGHVAAMGYSRLAMDGTIETAIVIGPNHTGMGKPISIMIDGLWETPLGKVKINNDIAINIANQLGVKPDLQAHIYEHSIEVQLPFLQYLYGSNFSFVPICMMDQSFETSKAVGTAISKVLSSIGKPKDHVIVASTDLTHYEPLSSAREKDSRVIKSITMMDEEQLYSSVKMYNISMCGYGPTIAAIVAAKRLGARKAEALKYSTSAEVTGDILNVVGYLSAIISR